MDIETKIQYLKGVGPKRAGLLEKLGIFSVRDLLSFYPRTYEDWSKTVSINDAPFGEDCCIKAIVDKKPKEIMIRKGMTLYKTEVTDGEGVLNITIFNNKYSAAKLEPGEEFLFFGKVTGNLWYREMNSPDIVKADTGERIRPIYSQTEGMNTKAIEKLIAGALQLFSDGLYEILPEYLKDKYNLISNKEAVRLIHFPEDFDDVKRARDRLIFEELLLLQLGLYKLKGRERERTSIKIETDYSGEFNRFLPFILTNAQKKAVSQAAEDMMQKYPMRRLLQGDVGSGKTAVAAALIYSAVKNGYQCALMAPTEILCTQHFNTSLKLLSKTYITVELLIGSIKQSAKKDIKQRLKNGEIDVIIGSHALLQNDVEFSNLGLIVTDEQHRFGVLQRSALGNKGDNPHTLVMSATPIPRTLALIIYGDLDISVLDELPPGRQKIETYAVESDKRERAYKYVIKHLDKGQQGYIVCPLVEKGEIEELASAEEFAKELSQGLFKNYSVGLLHGRMKADEKNAVMSAFIAGELQLLVSTTVIEVGVDVPNATIMVIENAERFGLSQLHQLRGRIGRGSEVSTCILISDSHGQEAIRRLEVMTKTTDGFKIADEDLRLRGPGDFFGSRQHGLPELKIADMVSDTLMIEKSKEALEIIIKKDPTLKTDENKALLKETERMFGYVGDAGMN